MGFFNLLETFFFISLAITFVLIMMLVYHFKGRILILEQKCDTMFEIMNNMVKEMKNIKYSTEFGTRMDPMMFQRTAASMGFNPETMLPTNESIFLAKSANLGEDDNSDSESDTDTESESGSEMEFSIENAQSASHSSVIPASMPAGSDLNEKRYNKIVVSDNEDAEAEVDSPIKIINIDMNDTVEDATDDIRIQQYEPAMEEILSGSGESITVNKIDIDFSASESNNEYLEKSEPVDYKKMDVSYLRTMVITRGLASDTKKLKKPDLIRLLEEAERDVIKQEE